MTKVTVAESKTIGARPEDVYAVLADYRHQHPQILPTKYFTNLKVLKGGTGAGTEFEASLRIMGSEQRFRMVVSEPEPGRVLMEKDLVADLETRFIFEPAGSDGTHLTIRTDFEPSRGLRGWVERVSTPRIMGRIYREELENIQAYMLDKVARGAA